MGENLNFEQVTPTEPSITQSNTTCTHEIPALFMRFIVSASLHLIMLPENVSKTLEKKHRQTGGVGIFAYISK